MKDISLRGLIEILIKEKIIIAITLVITLIIVVVGGTNFSKPSFMATTILLTKPIQNSQNPNSDDVTKLINSMGRYPDMTVETYRQQFINPTTLGNTITKLNLMDQNGNPLSMVALQGKIAISVVENTNLLRIVIQDNDANLAVNIANTLSEEFIDYISENAKELGEQATSIIAKQIENEKVKLEEQAKILQEYLESSPDIDQMKSEVDKLNEQIVVYKNDLYDVEKQILLYQETLEVINNGSSLSNGNDIDFKLNLPINLSDAEGTNDSEGTNENNNIKDNYKEFSLIIGDSNNLEESLLTISKMEYVTQLIKKQSEEKALQNVISSMEAKLEETKSTLVNEEYKYNALLRNYNLAEQTYNTYIDRHKEAVITTASEIGNSAIIISSPADISLVTASGYSRVFYFAFGFILGLMLGIFIALFKAYWKYSEPIVNNTLDK